jgi:DNA-binding MarR family transcriptional regulator
MSRFRNFEAQFRKHAQQNATPEMIAFFTMLKTMGMLNALGERHMERYGLSNAKVRVLYLLKARHDMGERGLLPSELSRFQGVQPNTITSLVAGLVEEGYIERTEHPLDKRKRIIQISSVGLDILEQIRPSHEQFITELMGVLTEEEQRTLTTVMQKLGDVVGMKLCDGEESEPSPESPPMRA